ncbi:hypothetical protein GBO84_09765 [Pediococcus pentosaceus]|nr:hypothetical protein GBO84_09765 [Pediococcus pentosaceus]
MLPTTSINLHSRLSPLKKRLMDADNTYLVLFGYQLLVVTMPKHRFNHRAVNGPPSPFITSSIA